LVENGRPDFNATNTVSRIVPVTISGRTFRIHIGGDQTNMERVLPIIRVLIQDSASEEAFLSELNRILAENQLVLADVFDLPPRANVSVQLYDVVKGVADSRTAEIAWRRLKALLFDAGDEDLYSLISPTDHLIWTRSYLESVIRDLDEDAVAARDELRSRLPDQYAYLLLD
jgi:hypothetical protein